MKKSFFIIISGPPGSGKTTLGKKIAKQLGLPFISKDSIKESLFDSLGWHDREWSKKIGMASVNLLYKYLESNLVAKRSIIIENAFITKYEKPKLFDIIQNSDSDCIEVYCFAEKQILLKRFEKRDKSGTRHSGHIQQNVINELKDRLDNNAYGRLDLTDNVILVDTGNFDKISIESITLQINEILSK
ncbi:MAG: AAA family ATPase [Candidatus Hodarchaeales archaeon]|jgi:cytidylate kinase